jgi:uncharacterized integral membrane protein
MFIFLIIGILVGAITVIFALQNVMTITVAFFTWHITGSLALVLIVAVIAGLIISTFFALPGIMRSHFRISALQKEVKRLEDELALKNAKSPQSAIDSILS